MTSDAESRPILVQFENGLLRPEFKETVDLKYMRSKVPKSTKRMLLANTGNLSYRGMVSHKQQGFVKYYVGVVDQKTNTIEAIQQCQLCTLKPKILDMKTDKDETTEKTYREKSDSLTAAFGSAKQKRLLSSRKKNEVVQSTISDKVADVAKQIVIDSPKPTIPIKQSDEADIMIIPPVYKDATQVSEIFHIDDIIDEKSYRLLKDLSQEIVNCNNETLMTWKAEKTYPQYILHHIALLPSSTNEREQKACYLCYLNYLMKVNGLLYKDLRKKDPCPAIPNPIKRFILNAFTTSDNGRNRCIPKRYKDKILCYIFVLALFIDDYEINCNLLMKDLTLTVPRITKLLRAIGCSTRTTSAKKRDADGEVIDAIPTVIATLSLTQTKLKEEFKFKTEENTNLKKEEGL